jgi:hypothetical protein
VREKELQRGGFGEEQFFMRERERDHLMFFFKKNEDATVVLSKELL